MRFLLALFVLLFLASCNSTEPDTADPTESAADAGAAKTGAAETESTERSLGDAVVVEESWQSAFHETDNVDSVAFWRGGRPDGDEVAWVIATGKESHSLIVYDADTGQTVRTVGAEGDGPGDFRRPNGVMIPSAETYSDLVLVAERDNHRVQVLRLPGFEAVGIVGADDLIRPYGLTVFEADGALHVYVTDNYETFNAETGEDEIPPAEELGERVKHFRLADHGGTESDSVTGELVRAFGATAGDGVLTKVETIFADPENDVLLIADEKMQVHRVYDLEGHFTGQVVGEGRFHYEPEGVALRRCDAVPGGGYWIATDQRGDTSFFRVLSRDSFAYVGTFVGQLTANTDGIAHTSAPFGGFASGAVFAVHDDQGVTAFDWSAIASALQLDC